MDTITILGMAGSLRQSSCNAALLRAATAAPAGYTVGIASSRGIPLYDGGVEAAAGVPAVVETLKERVAAAQILAAATSHR
jgi:NAD(P)H-dependent FMN reductase